MIRELLNLQNTAPAKPKVGVSFVCPACSHAHTYYGLQEGAGNDEIEVACDKCQADLLVISTHKNGVTTATATEVVA